ncbi:MAG: YbdD/YjiX family protein [Gammaproteobacteria bacterium]|nr:MAG: YbdD/YjiX family protein [Gammaproteobacteria bacterium]
MRGVAGLAARHAAALWSALRTASGDDAYERYRAHQAARHAGEPPLSRRAFYEDAQRRKWSGVSRCC